MMTTTADRLLDAACLARQAEFSLSFPEPRDDELALVRQAVALLELAAARLRRASAACDVELAERALARAQERLRSAEAAEADAADRLLDVAEDATARL
jgi:hypothetical protein